MLRRDTKTFLIAFFKENSAYFIISLTDKNLRSIFMECDSTSNLCCVEERKDYMIVHHYERRLGQKIEDNSDPTETFKLQKCTDYRLDEFGKCTAIETRMGQVCNS